MQKSTQTDHSISSIKFDAYMSSVYSVHGISFKVGDEDSVLPKSTSWVFTSVSNPRGELLSDVENELRCKKFEKYLNQRGIKFFVGSGTSECTSWSEKMYLINSDIDIQHIIFDEYDQDAYLTHDKNCVCIELNPNFVI